MNLQKSYGRYFPRISPSSDREDGFWYARYYPSSGGTRLELFRKNVFQFQDVKRVLNSLDGDYDLTTRSDAEERAFRLRSSYEAIEIYGYNFKIVTKNDMSDLPSWIIQTIVTRLKGRAYSRNSFSRTVTSSFFDKNILTKEDFNH